MACEAFIFDLDGTIWDSYPCYAAALNGDGTGDVIELLRSGNNIISLAKEANIGKSNLAKKCQANINRLKLFAGVADCLPRLMSKGINLGIVTNLPGWLARPFLEHFKIDHFFTSCAFSASKPKPTGLNRVIELMGVSKADSCFVGDSESDALAAKAATVPFVWAAYGYGGQSLAAYVSISQFSDVLNL